MKITNITLNPVGRNRCMAYVNVVFDDVFIIRGIRVVKRQNDTKLMLMPSMQNSIGEYKDVCHPLQNEFRDYLEALVFKAVEDMVAKGPPHVNGRTKPIVR
jgi:stage V sporulation protein G